MKAFLKDLDCSKKNLKKFGITIFICLFFIGLVLILRQKESYKIIWIFGALLLFLGIIEPIVLKPIYRIGMMLAFCLGWINTRILLILLYYIILTPLGLIMRIFGKDFLDLKLEKERESYWEKKGLSAMSKEGFEKTF